MSGEEVKKGIIELREIVVRLKLEELTKHVDSLTSHAKELYNYLQKQSSRFPP